MLGIALIGVISILILSVILMYGMYIKINKMSNKIEVGNIVIDEKLKNINNDIVTLDKCITNTTSDLDHYVRKITTEMMNDWRKQNVLSEEKFAEMFSKWSYDPENMSYEKHILNTLNIYESHFKDIMNKYMMIINNSKELFISSRHNNKEVIDSYNSFYKTFVNRDTIKGKIIGTNITTDDLDLLDRCKDSIDEFTDKFNKEDRFKIIHHEHGIHDFTLSDLITYIMNRVVMTKVLEDKVFDDTESKIFLDRLTFSKDSKLLKEKHPKIFEFINDVTDNTLLQIDKMKENEDSNDSRNV